MPRRKLRLVPLLNSSEPTPPRLQLSQEFAIEKCSGALSREDFDWCRRRISDEELDELLSCDLWVVHEFFSDLNVDAESTRSEVLTRFVVAFLRFLHPTQTFDGWYVQGFPNDGEAFQINQFGHHRTIFLEDCEARTGMAKPETFKEVARFVTDFQRITTSILDKTFAFNPIVIATRLSEQAYLDFHPEMRLLKRVMALEALFASQSVYGKQALIPRVAKFIGENMPIYPGTGTSYTVGSVVKDMCDLRNAFAHGNVVPERLVNALPESAVASLNVKSYADVLREASATIVRAALLKIFRDGLADTFSDKARMEALF